MLVSIKDGSYLVLLLLFSLITLVQLREAKEAKVTGIMESKTNERPHEVLLGGWEERDPQDEEILELLPSILTKVNEQSNDEYHLMPIKLLKVSSQVVAGVKYKMDVQVARSECKKSSNEKVDLKTCKKLQGHPDQVMTLEIWEKPWENFLRVNILETKVLP
ncbi:Onchocystatin [Dirofilaria immitis]